jgi:hypothetical protein
MKGDRVKAGWIDPTDIEKTAIETTPGLHEEREKKRTAP